MRQPDRQWHQGWSLSARKAKHVDLIFDRDAVDLFLRKVVLIKTLIAIGRQFLETRHDATRLAVEGRLIVADLVDNQPCHRGEIYARVGVKTGSNEQDLPWRRRIQQ